MSDITMKKERPKFLGLTEIRLPIAGFVSILHRVSGLLLFVSLPCLLWLFAASLGSQETFDSFKQAIAGPFSKLLLLAVLWAYLHHFCAGIRFLLLDMHKGLDKGTSRTTAIVVLVVSIALTLVFGGALLW